MRGVPPGKRGASFVCVLVLAGPAGREEVFEARITGRLLDAPRGGAGFGYDPLFVPDGFAQTYAELTEAEKNGISHRSKAWARSWRRGGPPPGPARSDSGFEKKPPQLQHVDGGVAIVAPDELLIDAVARLRWWTFRA